MFQHILVLWDGSQLSERAFAIASDLGDVYGAELTAVCVVERPHAHHRALTAARRHHERRSGSPLATSEPVQALFAKRHHDQRPGGQQPELLVLYGHDVVADLLELAYERGSDLVVVGHHSQHRPHHILPHGLTERLLLAVGLPLLVVGG
jgi:nucleotide-binding universal stress UspA family protein